MKEPFTNRVVKALLLLLLLAIPSLARGEPWKIAPASLLTRWAAEVSPTNAHPEYPRPQLVRSNWLSLNGVWDYAITPFSAYAMPASEGSILVPFPLESALSGVKRRLGERSTLWYQRRFAVPPEWAGSRVRLHFGAVDWQARVFVNGHEMATHRGGYDPFTIDITSRLKFDGGEELTVAVLDPTEGEQPRGKQSRNPEGIFYTPTSGIWQSVWLEPVPAGLCIDGLKAVPDLDTRSLRVKVAVNTLSDDAKVELIAYAKGKQAARLTGLANKELRLVIDRPHLWTPDDPFLYDLRVTLLDGDRPVDSVLSYFGMRKISVRKDESGTPRIALNDKFVFQVGVLDQGFWPDGIYTAPTDEALRHDIEFLKSAGLNLIRKHVKVEPERWYYWCDKLGMLVWQDMPGGNNGSVEGRAQFEVELERMVENLRNHPSIVLWVLFNEGWGQYDTERLTQWLKAMDPSRLVNSASGWTDKHVGDVIDIHSYPAPDFPLYDAQRAAVLGEYGGLGWQMEGHIWSDHFWGYQLIPDPADRLPRYSAFVQRVWILHNNLGLSAAVYTQATDVETECNGLLTYDRIAKLDPAQIREFNGGATTPPFRIIAPNALYGTVNWKYTTESPPKTWMKPDFDASAWSEGKGGFGTAGTPRAIIGTAWNTDDIWLRREFLLRDEDLKDAKFHVHHDEDVEIYLNGVLAAKEPGYSTDYGELAILPEAAATLRPGVNFMAVHCHQTTAGQFIDVGIVASKKAP